MPRLRWQLQKPAAVMMTINAGLASFELAHRLQPVGMMGAMRFVNDSKATNGDATARPQLLIRILCGWQGGAKADGLTAPHILIISHVPIFMANVLVPFAEAQAHMHAVCMRL